MPTGLSGADFGQVLDETIEALGPARAGEEDATIRGVGEALDGQVRVVAAPGGMLESLTIERSAMRFDPRRLAAEILLAVNTALDDLRARVAEASPAAPDPAIL